MSTIFYGKLGGRLAFPDGSDKFYDASLFRWEPIRALGLLADRHPDKHFVVVSPHDGRVQGWKPNVSSYYERYELVNQGPQFWEHFRAFSDYFEHNNLMPDNWIMWLGVNAVSSPIPKLDGSGPVKPLQSDVALTQPFVKAINRWRDESPLKRWETYLWPDARYYLKVRDLKWPVSTIVAQMDIDMNMKVHRYGDDESPLPWGCTQHDDLNWQTTVEYRYKGLETLMCVDIPQVNADNVSGVVLVANEIKRAPLRYELIQWVRNVRPDIHVIGDWRHTYPGEYEQVPHDKLHLATSGHAVGILPTLMKGRGMATAKFWEYVKADVMPVAAPGYDTQHHLPLPPWARADSYENLPAVIARAEEFRQTDNYHNWRLLALEELEARATWLLDELVR